MKLTTASLTWEERFTMVCVTVLISFTSIYQRGGEWAEYPEIN